METISRRLYKMLVVPLVASMAVFQAGAWNPPPGSAIDQTTPPGTPTALLKEAHGYIIQNGISILNNDGYWFAAQMMQQSQQELLNGVRYADVYLGRQEVVIKVCFIVGLYCKDVYSIASWPLAADNHYFNPDTGRGFDPGSLDELATWAKVLPTAILGTATVGISYLAVDVRPTLKEGYPSAVQMFDQEYANALNASAQASASGIGGRKGTALSMFYLGWVSHLMQDQTVVHHTFDEGRKHHAEYENAADGFVTTPPVANGQQMGIYDSQVLQNCKAGTRSCFASYAANASHNAAVLKSIEDGNYSNVQFAIPFAQSLQAGLYAAYLTDIGLHPIHMSAVMAAL